MRIIAIDTETKPFVVGCLAPPVICLSTCEVLEDRSKEFKIYGRADLDWRVREFLIDAIAGATRLVGHYVAYDMACLMAALPQYTDYFFRAYEANGIACTGIREKLLDIAEGCFRVSTDSEGKKTKQGYSLQELSKKHLNEELEKGDLSWQLKFESLEKIPVEQWPQAALAYCRRDVDVTLRLYQFQEQRAELDAYAMPTQYDDVRADFALRLMSAWGITTDQKAVFDLKTKQRARLEELSAGLIKNGLAVNLSTPTNQVSLFDDVAPKIEVRKNLSAIRSLVAKKLKDPPRTPGGHFTRTDKETLEACHCKEIDELLEYNTLEKALSTYVDKLAALIHAEFIAIGAESGRTSCRKPNLQNIPRVPGIRECFVPRNGYSFLACDFDAQEMRTLAQSCLDLVGHSKLAQAFQRSKKFDPHLEFGELLAQYAGHGKALDYRQRAKAANFGFPAGLGVEKFVKYAQNYGIDLSEEQAKEIKSLWFKAWPEMREYFKIVSNVVDEQLGVVVIPQSGFARSGCGYSEAANAYFQTLAAHASKSALWEVCKRCYCDPNSYLYGARPVLFIHDEIVVEISHDAALEAAREMPRILEEAQEKWTPDVPAAASATLMPRWSKK